MAKEITIQFQRIKSLKENDTYRIITTTLPDGTTVSQSIADTILYYGEPLYIEDTKFLLIGNGRVIYDDKGNKKFAADSKTVRQLIDAKEYYQIATEPIFKDAALTGTTDINGPGNYKITIDPATYSKEIANTEFVQNAIYRAAQVFIGPNKPTVSSPLDNKDYFAIWIDTSVEGKQTLRYQNANDSTQDWPLFDRFTVSYDQIIDGQGYKRPVPGDSTALPKIDGGWTGSAYTYPSGYAGDDSNKNTYSRVDHVHPTDTSRAPLNSPALTGTPTAPDIGSSSTISQIATKTYVDNLVNSKSIIEPKTSDNSKTIYVTGVYTDDNKLYYSTQGTHNGVRIDCAKGVLKGAAWNDFAEYRQCLELPGTVVCEAGDGSLVKSSKRLQAGAAVVSDTYGMIIGPENKDYAPIAIAGRVLVKYSGKLKNYKPGTPVCATKNGCITKMTRLETILFSDRILGYVSEIPSYNVWNKINVNNRIWIKVR